jgi:ankyrin repeat protein
MKSTFAQKAAIMTDPNNATPLHLVCASVNVGDMIELVELLGTKEAAVQTDGKERTPMHMAAENTKATKQLIKTLGEINIKAAKMETTKGRMPLHVALRKKADESVIKAFLRINPKAVKVVFDGNNTLFHEMCQYK